MKQQSKAIWFFFGLGALLVILGTIGWMTSGDAGGTAVRQGGVMDMVFQIAYPAALVVLAAGLLYLLIRRTRR